MISVSHLLLKLFLASFLFRLLLLLRSELLQLVDFDLKPRLQGVDNEPTAADLLLLLRLDVEIDVDTAISTFLVPVDHFT